MRIAYITAGAGGMYCGSCMHDNTLAAALLKSGRDVVLVPVFTPIRTDEPDVSIDKVYYGGINVYLQQKTKFFRRLPRFLDRVLDSPGLLRFLIRTPKSADEEVGRITVSVLEGEHGAQTKELDKLLAGLSSIKPDLVNLPNAMFLGVAKPIREELGLPVVCNLSGEDLFLETLMEPYRTRSLELIRNAAKHVNGFVVGNKYYGDYAVKHFGIPEDRLRVIPFGIRMEDSSGSHLISPGSEGDFTIGYLARICREKGLHVLCDAFARLRAEGRSCRLRIAGYLGANDRGYLDQLTKKMRGLELDQHFDVLTNVSREDKLGFLGSLSVLSVPTVYQESKGLYLLEAWATGLPVIQPDHGCFPEMIEASGGGLLFRPDDASDLANSLARLMDDRELRVSLGGRGRQAVLDSLTDRSMAERTWSLYEEVVGGENRLRTNRSLAKE